MPAASPHQHGRLPQRQRMLRCASSRAESCSRARCCREAAGAGGALHGKTGIALHLSRDHVPERAMIRSMCGRPRLCVPRMLGRYALYDKIASGGMATVHFGRLLGPVGLLAHRRHQAPAPALRRGPRVRLDVPRRGAARRAHPPPQRRAHARRRRDGRRAVPRHGVRAGRVARAPDPRRERSRRAHPAGDGRRRSWSARCTACTRRTRRRTSAASRSASCTATCARRTSSSASTASRACSTSASPRRRAAADDARRAAQGQARVHGARADARRR